MNPTVKRLLELLKDGSSLVPNEIKENYNSLIQKIKEGVELTSYAIGLIDTALVYLFNPEEGYVTLVTQIAGMIDFTKEASNLKSDLPKDLQPLVDEMEESLSKAEQLIKQVEKEVDKLIKVWRNDI